MSRKDLALVLIRVLALWFAGNWVVNAAQMVGVYLMLHDVSLSHWDAPDRLWTQLVAGLVQLLVAVLLWFLSAPLARRVGMLEDRRKPPRQPDAYADSLSSLTDDDA